MCILIDKEYEKICQTFIFTCNSLSDVNSIITQSESIIQEKQTEYDRLNEKYSELNNSFIKANLEYEQRIAEISEILSTYFDTKEKEINKKVAEMSSSYTEEFLELRKGLVNDLQSALAARKDEIKKLEEELNQLKKAYASRIEIKKHEIEEENKRRYYMIQLDDDVLNDIIKIKSIEINLKRADILNKLIWKTYLEKPTNDLINRVLGTSTICGIYKITNVNTEEVYIGQSVNVRDRWKSHIKRGVGAEGITSNKLYPAMMKEGVWNFSFELLEECERSKLNERESYWISFYDSASWGMNLTKGNA